MEPETGAAAKGKDSDDDQNAPDPSSLTGKKANQDQQILMATGDTNWYKNTQALKYLQPVFMPIVKDKMKSLQLQSMTDFGRQLCAEATDDDIILGNGRLAQFKHLCPGTVVACQNLLNIIKGHTSDSVNFYQMLKGTDPQNWLKSPFQFVRLFLQDWMRSDIHDFEECDITALCTIVKRCKPLMQIFEERKIDELRNVRNRTMHPATMSISQQEMENNIDVILDFLEHIKSLKSTDEVTEAIENIKQLRTGDVRLLHSVVVRLIQGWLPDARKALKHKTEKVENQNQDIMYMETILARLSSGQDITSFLQSAEFEAKTTQLTDASQKLKLTTEELAKEKEERRELEKQLEEQRKLRQEEKRELEKQIEELRKLRQEEKRESEVQIKKLKERLKAEQRELEKQNEELEKHLETNKRWIFGEECRPEEIYIQRSPDEKAEVVEKQQREFENRELEKPWETNNRWIFGEETYIQRSPDEEAEVVEPHKRTASSGERFPTQALSASTSSGAKHGTVKEDFSKPKPPPSYWKKELPDHRMLHAKRRRMSEEVAKPQPPFHSPRMTFPTLEKLDLGPSPATVCNDVSTIPVKSDKDKRRCCITGMVAISGTQLVLADDNNKCIKLVDLERGTVIGVKELPSAPHDVTCVAGSRVAVTIPAIHQIHIFTADRYLEQCGIMGIDGICLGIHCSGNRCFVSCKHPPLVQILNMDGDIINTIKLYSVEYPMYLTCSPDNKFMYVIDFCNDTVTCMDMKGSVHWLYNCRHSKSSGLNKPRGVCTGDGCIYICIFDEIHVVSLTGTKLAVIPFTLKGEQHDAVCYSSQERTLYVSRFPSVADKVTYISRIRLQ